MKRIWLLAGSIVTGVVFARNAQPVGDTARFLGPNRSLTLDEAVAFAVEHNPSILTAEQEIARTQGLVIQVRAEALPQIDLASDYSQEQKTLLSGGATGATSTNSTRINRGHHFGFVHHQLRFHEHWGHDRRGDDWRDGRRFRRGGRLERLHKPWLDRRHGLQHGWDDGGFQHPDFDRVERGLLVQQRLDERVHPETKAGP